ncbi:MAG: hypothetical protein NTZ07_03235 [Candidatus Woesebacteria bacterium]|nr:hypothetical protein [Candidatus Woesebacteria bacterium]
MVNSNLKGRTANQASSPLTLLSPIPYVMGEGFYFPLAPLIKGVWGD